MASTSKQIGVGTSWTSSSGKTWTVIAILPFGRANDRSGFQFGEMRFCDIRRALSDAKAA